MVEVVGWGNLKSNGLNLIDWNIDVLGPFLPLGSIGSFGGKKTLGSWGSFGGLFLGLSSFSCGSWSSWSFMGSNNNILSMNWFIVMVMLFVVLLVVFVGTFLVLDLFSNMGLDHILKLTISECLGTFF